MIRRVILGLLVALGIGAHTSGSAGPVFVPFFTAADWAVNEVEDPAGLAPVAVIQRFEVRPGQCISTPPFHDCERGVERAELGQAIVPRGSGDTHWYRWQVFFPNDFVTAYPVRNRHGQFVDYGTGESAWAFEIGSTGALWVGSQFDDESRYFSVINERDLRGEWHDVIVEAVWSRDKGRLNVWVNGQRRVRYQGATCDRCRIALTYGIARHGVGKFKERYPQKTLPVQAMYYLAAEAYAEDPGWIATPPPVESEPEDATPEGEVITEAVTESKSEEEGKDGQQEPAEEGSTVAQPIEVDSSGSVPGQKEEASDEVTIVPESESDAASVTVPETIGSSDAASSEQPIQTIEVGAEAESVSEIVEGEEQDSSDSEVETTSVVEPEDTQSALNAVSPRPLPSDTDDRR